MIPLDVLQKLQHVAFVRGAPFVAANAKVSTATVEAVCACRSVVEGETVKLVAWVKEFVS